MSSKKLYTLSTMLTFMVGETEKTQEIFCKIILKRMRSRWNKRLSDIVSNVLRKLYLLDWHLSPIKNGGQTQLSILFSVKVQVPPFSHCRLVHGPTKQ